MMPTHRSRILPLLLISAVLGCDSTPVAPRTPHGGTILPIPEKKGSVEFVKKAVEGQGEQVQLTAYFFGPDDKIMPSTPTAATFKPSGRGAKAVEFKPSGEADSPLISEPFNDQGENEGELSLTIDGKPIKMPIRVR